MKKHTIRALMRRMPVIFAIGSFVVAVQAAPVTPPSRPLGSDQVQVGAGLNPDEVKRHERAYKHSRLEKKDYTRDDTLDARPDHEEPGPDKSKGQAPKSK